MKKIKVAIVHPRILAGGGSESCSLWIVEALKHDYDVSLITMGDANLEVFNKSFNTSLKEGEIRVVSLPVGRFFKKRFDALRSIKLIRYCRKVAPQFDAMISTYNAMNFGVRSIQYIVDLSYDDELRREFDPEPAKSKKWLYEKSFLRNIYLKIAEILSGNYPEGYKKNCTLVVSKWIGEVLENAYGIKTHLLYPPIFTKASNVGWDKKENGFLFLGRVSPEKQVEKIIQIIKGVREGGQEIHLHIVGRVDEVNEKYGAMIRQLCRDNKEWCFMEGPIYDKEKLDFVARHKYGISARTNEASGLGVFEMVKSGCIVFAPNGGGQTEAINDSALIYDDVNDAVKKILLVVKDDSRQSELRSHLSKQSEKFTIENFTKEIKEYVELFLQKKI